jgi:hypothetical protein
MERVVPILVGPLLCHSLLTLLLEAKLTLVTISLVIVTMEPHKLRFRVGLGLLTWFLFTRLLYRFLLTRLLTLFPKEHIPQVALELDRLLEVIWDPFGFLRKAELGSQDAASSYTQVIGCSARFAWCRLCLFAALYL